ncbi:L,D-transpeptidase family protein [Streptomyces sp. VRA16 Mangrove soil]|uniref:L,D-transpeptidase family protein n=1 Tax=Streptomyces sp. VRA16 Mangrove soil TaxID=2817434 RepID=UPI001A9E625F|nr:L,D-transpeptidase family protein [Streptomyces sp. VRA16 Mangrove soil]MBO1332338.1 L,D-transpeptidase family protein [Streptomyces sp. VRA16 Mangrove soil]
MRIAGAVRAGVTAAACGVLLTTVAACGADGGDGGKPTSASHGAADDARSDEARSVDLKTIPDVGDRYQQQIPANARQVVAVYGDGKDSADSTIALYTRSGTGSDATWKKERSWSGHNGKKGWTTDHHEGDKRSPVGVFTLSDAGGVLADPGAKLPYTQTASIQAPHYWAKSHWHDFDYVIAIDYNRVKGTAPNDPTRPQGQSKGGSIWLHMDHGSGTSACVSQSKTDMEYLLKTLDPKQHPVVVMGDKADLKAS